MIDRTLFKFKYHNDKATSYEICKHYFVQATCIFTCIDVCKRVVPVINCFHFTDKTKEIK